MQVVHVPANLSTWILLPFQIAALLGLQLWSNLSNRIGRVATLRWGAGLWISACLLSMLFPPLAADPSLLQAAAAGGADCPGGGGSGDGLSDPLVAAARCDRR